MRRRRILGGQDTWPVPESAGPAGIPVPEDLAALRTLLRISQTVLRANYFDEALEVIAEQTLTALRAASVSISRWERRTDHLRTLINVGLCPSACVETRRVASSNKSAALIQSPREFLDRRRRRDDSQSSNPQPIFRLALIFPLPASVHLETRSVSCAV